MEFTLYSVICSIGCSIILLIFLRSLLTRNLFNAHLHYDFLTMIVWLLFFRLFLPFSFLVGFIMPWSDFCAEIEHMLDMPLFLGITGYGWISWIWLLGALIASIRHFHMNYRAQLLGTVISCGAKTVPISSLYPGWKGPDYTVILSPHVNKPFVMVCSERIVMPASLFPPRDLEYILEHEAQHLFNEDRIYIRLMRVIQILYWWMPGKFWLLETLELFYEVRVDSMLSDRMSEESKLDYVQCLLRLSRLRSTNLDPRLTRNVRKSLAFSKTCQIEKRTRYLLAKERPARKTKTSFYVLLYALFFLGAFFILTENRIFLF